MFVVLLCLSRYFADLSAGTTAGKRLAKYIEKYFADCSRIH